MYLGEERKSNFECILLSMISGLWCEIWSHMREISVSFDSKKNLVTLYVYYDRPLTTEEIMDSVEMNMLAELVADYPIGFEIEARRAVIPYPEKIRAVGIPIYRRYEVD